MRFALSNLDIVAIKLLSLLNTGVMDLSDWEDDDELYDLRLFVNEDLMDDFDYQIQGHPYSYISDYHFEFLDRLNYYETFPGNAPTYETVNSRFWLMTKLYKRTINQLEQMLIIEERNKTSNDRLRS